jgi:hypothetical protein
MFRRKKKPENVDLLSLPDSEKAEVIKKIRRQLQERVRREKGLRDLLKVETITVKGKVVYDANEPLRGVNLPSKL